MGRALLITCAGLLVAFGYIGYGSTQQTRQIVGGNVGYAERMNASNAARTVLQMAMQEMYEDETWRDDKTESTPWVKQIDDFEVHLYIEMIYEETDPAKYYVSDIARVVSTAYYSDPVSGADRNAQVISIYGNSVIDEYVQSFKSGVAVATENVKFTSDGPGIVSGTDVSGQCSDKPAIIVINESVKSQIEKTKEFNIEGDIITDSTLNFDSTADMVDRLEDHPDAIYLNGNYWGEMGTADSPEVFFVEGPSQISDELEEGYGILVIRSNGEIAMEDSVGNKLSLAENFTFNGLSIFENAYSLKGENVPSVNGSVVIMNTNGSTDEINIDLSDSLHFQYDCSAEKYVKVAASQLLPYKRYRRISTFE